MAFEKLPAVITDSCCASSVLTATRLTFGRRRSFCSKSGVSILFGSSLSIKAPTCRLPSVLSAQVNACGSVWPTSDAGNSRVPVVLLRLPAAVNTFRAGDARVCRWRRAGGSLSAQILYICRLLVRCPPLQGSSFGPCSSPSPPPSAQRQGLSSQHEVSLLLHVRNTQKSYFGFNCEVSAFCLPSLSEP